MAAPCFYSPNCLSADLATLGFENAHDPAAVSHTGKGRLETLAWLASVVDPTFEDATEENLAAFWDRLGLHSAPRNSAGHCVPLTVAGDKQRDRNAAGLYLRTAIDLAMAFRRRREMRPSADSDGDGSNGVEEDDAPVLTEEDIIADSQLETLIKQRHVLFPSTVGLFEQPQGRKRRPLAQRKPSSSNRGAAGKSPQSKASSAKDFNEDPTKTLKSREELLERLRAIQREAQDLKRATGSPAGTELSGKASEKASDDADHVESQPAFDDEAVRSLAEASEALTKLVAEFNDLSMKSLTSRQEQTNLAKRDQAADERVSSVVGECDALEEEVRMTLLTARKVQESVSKLVHGRRLLESLPNSYAVRAIVEHSRRLDSHM